MDGFTAGFIFWIGTLVVAFMVGRYTPNFEVVEDCTNKGEVIINSTYIQCKPTAQWVGGKKVELEP